MESNMTLEVQPKTPASNIFITNMAGRHTEITYLKINDTELVNSTAPYNMTLGAAYKAIYNEKYWDRFERIIINIKMDNISYHIDLNKDHYFGGGDFHYPGKGSQVNFMLFGVNPDRSKIELCLTYGEYFSDTGAKRLLYSNDVKYLNVV